MNQLEQNHNLSFSNDFSFFNEFSSGIEYCHYEQQIELSISFFAKEKPKTTFIFKIKQILSKWKKWIGNYSYPSINYQENQLVEKSQLLLKKVSAETAWISSLLALTSIGVVAEITPMWSAGNQNLSFKLPLLKNASRVQKSIDRLFPLLAMEEIELIIFEGNGIDHGEHDFGLSPPINSQVDKQEWLMYQTKANGSLMAIPPLYNQPSVAGFPSFLSTLDFDFINFPKYFNVNQFNSLNQNKLLSNPLDSLTYDIEDKLMAIPREFY